MWLMGRCDGDDAAASSILGIEIAISSGVQACLGLGAYNYIIMDGPGLHSARSGLIKTCNQDATWACWRLAAVSHCPTIGARGTGGATGLGCGLGAPPEISYS